MKLIIAGSRDMFISQNLMNSIICDFQLEEKIIEVVCGDAEGMDTAGRLWQQEMKILCGSNAPELKRMPADWDTHGKAAGPIRNRQMAEYADALLLIWDGESRGSANMKSEMKKLGKPIYEVIIKNP